MVGAGETVWVMRFPRARNLAVLSVAVMFATGCQEPPGGIVENKADTEVLIFFERTDGYADQQAGRLGESGLAPSTFCVNMSTVRFVPPTGPGGVIGTRDKQWCSGNDDRWTVEYVAPLPTSSIP
jgi:hypothetical protein